MIMVNLHFVRDVVPLADSDETSGIEHKVSLGLNTNQVKYRHLSNLFHVRGPPGLFKKRLGCANFIHYVIVNQSMEV